MIGTAPGDLRALVDRLERAAERRLALGPRSEPAATRARQLVDHLRSHVRVRASSLDAPLVVLLVGPTGAGKSTIFNTIVGRGASPTGVLRPTTRMAVVLAHPTDRESPGRAHLPTCRRAPCASSRTTKSHPDWR
jgi:ATPase subunit of ABC transporter with duplicated ATPase domains